VLPHGAQRIQLFAQALPQVTPHGVLRTPFPAQVLQVRLFGAQQIPFLAQAHNIKIGCHPLVLLVLKNGAKVTQFLVLTIVLLPVKPRGASLIRFPAQVLRVKPLGV
jgi:hypothetical protein